MNGVDTWKRPVLAWYGVGMVSLVTLVGQLDRGIMAMLIQPIKAETGFTDTQISLLMGLAYSITYMAVGLPMARFADTARRTWILPGALTVWSVGTALCGLAQSFWSFFIFRGLVGAGEAVKGPTSTSLLPDLVKRDRLPRAFGVYNLCVTLGESLALILGGLMLAWFAVLAPIHVPGVGDLHGWRMVYLVCGVPGIALAVWFVLTVPEPMRHGRRSTGAAPIKEVAVFLFRGPMARVYIPLLISAMMNGLFWMGTTAWRPSFYERTYGLPPEVYGPITGIVSIATAPIGIVLGTILVERMIKRRDDAHMRLAFYTDMTAIPIAIATPLMPTFELALAGQIAVAILLMMSQPARFAAMQIITPNEMRAQANAVFMFTISVVGSVLGPTAVALLTDFVFRDEADLRYAMMTMAAVTVPLLTLGIWLTLKPYGKLYRAAIEAEAHGARMQAAEG